MQSSQQTSTEAVHQGETSSSLASEIDLCEDADVESSLLQSLQSHTFGPPNMKKHEWREKTEEGETRLVTVIQHGGKWRIQSRLKTETEWTQFPVIPLDDLETLREILWNKYQRSRVPHEHVLEIDKMIKAAKR